MCAPGPGAAERARIQASRRRQRRGSRERPRRRRRRGSNFFAKSVPHLLTQAPFRGRQAVLGLPASVVHIQILTIGPTDDKDLKDAVFREASRKLPFETSHALVRHAITRQDASEIQVIVMAADMRWVKRYIAAAQDGRLNVVAMNVQPLALLDCFAHIHRRKSELESTRFYIDLGSCGTRAIIVARHCACCSPAISPSAAIISRSAGGVAWNRVSDDARTLRVKLGAGPRSEAGLVDLAFQDALDELIGELDLCRRDHESAFSQLPVERLIFVGGEARQRGLCKRVAKRLGLPSQIGDSLRRMACHSKTGIEIAIDRRHPQPALGRGHRPEHGTGGH